MIERVELGPASDERGGVERQLGRDHDRRDLDAGRRHVELGRLSQDGDLHASHLGPGVDAELLGQCGLGEGADLQRLRRLPVAVERQHELRDQALPGRHRGDQVGQLANELAMMAEVELDGDAFFDRGDALLVQPGTQPLSSFVRKLGRQDRPAPKPLGVAQRPRPGAP